MRMKETGPEATPPVEPTTSFLGRSREKENPVPPPLWWMRAIFLRASNIPGRESSTGRTKQADSCPKGSPAFINVGELGKNSRPAIISRNRRRYCSASPPYLFSARATCPATRSSICSGASAILPNSSRRRYRFSKTSMALADSSSPAPACGSFIFLPSHLIDHPESI